MGDSPVTTLHHELHLITNYGCLPRNDDLIIECNFGPQGGRHGEAIGTK